MARTQRSNTQAVRQIGSRLINVLLGPFGLTMTEAALELGYANATTLHKVRRGLALPDPQRLAKFAREQSINRRETLNLHWVLTGQGTPLIERSSKATASHEGGSVDDDIIKVLAYLDPSIKDAVRVLLLAQSPKPKAPSGR